MTMPSGYTRKDSPQRNQRSTAGNVLEAAQDLHAREQIVTREALSDLTGLTLAIIDDRLAYLIDSGRIHRVQRGVFVPAESHRPARPISRTMLPDGTTVLEVGDDVLKLTPREARMLSEIMSGTAQQFVAIELGHQATKLSNMLGAQLSEVRRDVTRLREQINSDAARPL